MARRLATAVFALGCMHTSVVAALGLGELKLDSFLNEPLSASVSLLNTGGLHEDQIRVRLATSEDFKKLGLDRAYFLTSIKFEIKIDDQGNGRIVLTSEDPVLEPYLDFLIEARWPSGRLLREYTVLVDPPAFDSQAPIVSASEKVAEIDGDSDDSGKKKTPVASSGTQVATRGSDNGQVSDRQFGSETTPSPLAGDEYLIRRDETLWSIAVKSRPENTSVHQTMLDIQRLNPDAFIDGNINKIKAGYIIYLPASNDISSDDQASAEEEVRQQNQDWQESREQGLTSGPALRISAEPVDESQGADAESETTVASSVASDQSGALAAESAELSERLVAMEQQVETLERIVSLKDDQISALQQALAESAESPSTDGLTTGSVDGTIDSTVDAANDVAQEQEGAPAEPEAAVESKDVEPEKKAAPVVKPTPEKATQPPAVEEGGGFLGYALGLLAAVGVGVLLFLRRRKASQDDNGVQDSAEDAFADVELQDPEVEVAAREELSVAAPVIMPELAAKVTADAGPDNDKTAVEKRSGYGEHKHDEYASDEAGDALAEADIYIAYGRYPQAVDLLKTAINNEPQTSAYRLKLLELSVDMGDTDEAQAQFAQLQSIGDASSIARAERLLSDTNTGKDWTEDTSSHGGEVYGSPEGGEMRGLLDDVDLSSDSGEELQADFGELEIEPIDLDSADDELDLSADFVDSPEGAEPESEEEDLVFAAGGSEMSTKLDLARAYLDMGDEDGAKEILQEVSRGGATNEVEEAKILLDRLG